MALGATYYLTPAPSIRRTHNSGGDGTRFQSSGQQRDSFVSVSTRLAPLGSSTDCALPMALLQFALDIAPQARSALAGVHGQAAAVIGDEITGKIRLLLRGCYKTRRPEDHQMLDRLWPRSCLASDPNLWIEASAECPERIDIDNDVSRTRSAPALLRLRFQSRLGCQASHLLCTAVTAVQGLSAQAQRSPECPSDAPRGRKG